MPVCATCDQLKYNNVKQKAYSFCGGDWGLALLGERPGEVCLQAFLTCYRSSGRSVYRHVLSRPRALSFKALLQVGFGAKFQFCVIGHEEQDAEVNFKALR